MNFIVVMNDTLRPDYLSAYGNGSVQTPNATAFAREAAVFDNAFVGSFPTIPNRTDLFTGRFGEPFHPWLPLKFGTVTLPQLLAEQGYVTQLICDTPHLINGGHNFDFPFHAWDFIRGQEIDRYGMDCRPIDLPYRATNGTPAAESNRSVSQFLRNVRGRRVEQDWAGHQTCQRAIDWLQMNAGHERFFLWIDAFDPHEPNLPPQHYVDLYDPGYTGDRFIMHVPDPAKLSAAEIDNVIARYSASVTQVGRYFGRILQTVDDLGLADTTCVIWMSDHGTYLNEHGKLLTKTCEYDEIARTVLMIRMPGGAMAGRRVEQIVQPADMAPTLLEVAGLASPENMQGHSFLPMLRGEDCPIREVAISSHGSVDLRGRRHVIRAHDGRWLLLDRPDPADRELYDTESDPKQLTNLVADHPDEAGRLHQAVLDFLKTHEAQPQLVRLYETGDPGDLAGYRSRPPGYEQYRMYAVNLLNSGVVDEGQGS